MPKLTPSLRRLLSRGTLCVVAAMAGAHAAAATPPRATAAPARLDLLSELTRGATTGTFSAESAAAVILAAGPAPAATIYDQFEAATELTPTVRQRLQRALREAPAVIVTVASHPELEPSDRLHAHRVALEVLSSFPTPDAPELFTSTLSGLRSGNSAHGLGPRIEAVAAQLVTRRDFESHDAVVWLRAAGPSMGSSVVDGLAKARALMPLVDALRRHTGAEPVILNRVAGLIQRGEPVSPERTILATAPYLLSERAFERAEASAILGFVGDRRHVKPLIDCLNDEDHLVRTSALKALKSLTGMTISGDPRRWKQWHAAQKSWWDTGGADLVASMGTVGRNQLMGVLKDVSTRRLYRREISTQLVALLDRPRSDEVRVAIAGLATLRDPSTLGALLPLRNHPDSLVRASVEDAVVAFRHAGIKPSRVTRLPTQ